MSLVFSDTDNLNGILQLIEKEIYSSNYGYITNNTTRKKEWTAEVNLVHDEVLTKAIKAGGTWQADDINHPKLPFIETDLISGQRDYTFTTDEQGNIILDIYRVMVKDSSGVYQEVNPVDVQTRRSDTKTFFDGNNSGGAVTRYDKTANGILLDLIPNYSWRNSVEGERGLKVFINREGTYFLTTDTDKKPGVDGRIHEYYVVAPCYKYAARKGLKVKDDLLRRKLILEQTIEQVYGIRHRDEPRRMMANIESSK